MSLESLTSKWQVVALGELQQPGGVGATNEYNPVVDGPNPDGASMTDNSGNSPEQENAMQDWVNFAVNWLNQGAEPQAVLAKLADKRCPDPEGALQMALQRPNQTAVDNSLGQDPFEAPSPADDPAGSGQMQGLSQQPPVTTSGTRVRVIGSTMTGTITDEWTAQWDQGLVRIALDEGGSVNVAPTAVEQIDETPRQPVSEIQQFINSLPKVEPTRPNIEARLTNLELVRRAVRSTISKVGFSDQRKLEAMDRAAEEESAVLKEWLASNLVGEVVSRPYRINALGLGAVDVSAIPPFRGNPKEAGVIWASEGPWIDGFADEYDFRFAAVRFAETHNMTAAQFNTFMKAAEDHIDRHRIVRTEEFDAEPDNDGPAEALFV